MSSMSVCLLYRRNITGRMWQYEGRDAKVGVARVLYRTLLLSDRKSCDKIPVFNKERSIEYGIHAKLEKAG